MHTTVLLGSAAGELQFCENISRLLPRQKSKLCINSSISLYFQYVEDVMLNCHEKLKIHSKLVIKHSLWVSAVCIKNFLLLWHPSFKMTSGWRKLLGQFQGH